MTRKLERLTVSSFRGATGSVTIEFESKPVVLIYGENGTGKTTIVDAFDAVCNEYAGSVRERSTGDWAKFLPSTNASAADLSVELRWEGKTWKAELSKNKLRVAGGSDRPEARILRRSQLLSFIEAQPATRYEAFREFLAFPKYEKAEAALRSAAKNAASEAQEMLRDQVTAEQNLRNLWEREGSPGESAPSWATSLASETVESTERSESEVGRILAALTVAIDARERYRAKRRALEASESARDEAAAALVDVRHDDTETGPELLRLLESAERYFGSDETAGDCPVCSGPINLTDALRSVRERLGAAQALRDAVDALSKAEAHLRTASREAEADLAAWTAAVARLKAAILECDLDFVTSHCGEAASELDLAAAVDPEERARRMSEFVSRVQEVRNQLASERDRAAEARTKLNAVRVFVDSLTTAVQQNQYLNAALLHNPGPVGRSGSGRRLVSSMCEKEANQNAVPRPQRV